MNDSEPSPINLDELRLLPDWLRQEGPSPSKQYASHEGDTGEGGPRRGARPGGFNRDRDSGRGFGGGGGRRDSGRRPGPGSGTGRREEQGRPPREEHRSAPTGPVMPAPVRVEFLPDEKCMASINKQIRATHLAYPLFGLARMFLQEPARHWVQFTVLSEAVASGAALYQLGEDGPVVTDRAVLERAAFDTVRDTYYVEQTEQKEPPKGNFTNVARNRLSGALLGPTNYHGYQPALRTEYESKFSRRMSFEDYRRNIEVVSDPALVERWKEEARTTTTIATRDGDPPTVLPSVSEARAHFRQHHLDLLLRAGTTFKVHGSVARNLPEPAMMNAIRQAHDTELRYPAQFVQFLRQGLQNAGLHIFKHRKRVVYVSIARPTPFAPDGAVSTSVAAILETVKQFPLCSRKTLAEKVLAHLPGGEAKPVPAQSPQTPEPPEASTLATVEITAAQESSAPTDIAPAPETSPTVSVTGEDALARAKAALGADLRFLVQSGHLIEFHNGTFDLPLPPKAKEEPMTTRPVSEPRTVRSKAVEDDIPLSSEPEATDAERDDLTLESATISPPDGPRESEPAPSPDAGLEKTEAFTVSDPGQTASHGTTTNEPHGTPPDIVVIGDAESAHPLSPP